MNYIIYNKVKEILCAIQCSPTMSKLQVKEGEFIMEGTANDATQKVEFDGFDENGQPINPRVIDKTPEEIEVEKPPKPEPISYRDRYARITNDGLASILKDIIDLKEKVAKLEAVK